jgi:hypothetical protein
MWDTTRLANGRFQPADSIAPMISFEGKILHECGFWYFLIVTG